MIILCKMDSDQIFYAVICNANAKEMRMFYFINSMVIMIYLCLSWEFSDLEPVRLRKPYSRCGMCNIYPAGMLLHRPRLVVKIAGWADLRPGFPAEFYKCLIMITIIVISKKGKGRFDKGIYWHKMYMRNLNGCGIHLLTLGGGCHVGELLGDLGEGRGSVGTQGRHCGGGGEGAGGGGRSRWPREEDLGHGVDFRRGFEQGEDLVLGPNLGGGRGGVQFDGGEVFLVNINVSKESSLQKIEGGVLHCSVMGGLEGLDVDFMEVLIFQGQGGGLEQGSVRRTGVGCQEPGYKCFFVLFIRFKGLRTYVTMIGLLTLRFRREGALRSWIGKGKPKTLAKIRPTSDMRSSPLVYGFTLRPEIIIELRRKYESGCNVIIIRWKHTRLLLCAPVQGMFPGSADGCPQQPYKEPDGWH